jgi:hypothetical protein
MSDFGRRGSPEEAFPVDLTNALEYAPRPATKQGGRFMSHFKMKDKPHGKPRKKPWCVEWKEGGKKRRLVFKTEREAKEVDEDNNTNIRRTGLGLLGVRELERWTVRELVRSYIYQSHCRHLPSTNRS